NFGESFYMAQRALAWKLVAVGDPLYAPVVFRTDPPVNVSVAPGPVAYTGGGQPVQMIAAVTGGSGNKTVTWSVTPQVGTISANGLYTAPLTAAAQTVTVKATSVADPTQFITSPVSLLGPLTVKITPATATMVTGQQQLCSAAVSGTSNTQ